MKEQIEKQAIEEMKNILCESIDGKCNGYCGNCNCIEQSQALYNAGYRKQEWISVDERLPEDVYKDRKIITVLVCTKSGRVSTSSRVRMMMVNKEKKNYEYTDVFEWSGQIAKKVTHWMPLPEAPKMKGGE